MSDQNKIASRIFGKHLKIEEDECEEENKVDINNCDEKIAQTQESYKQADKNEEIRKSALGKGDDNMEQKQEGNISKSKENENVLYLEFDSDDEDQNNNVSDGELDDLFIEFEDDEHISVPFEYNENTSPKAQFVESEEEPAIIEQSLDKSDENLSNDMKEEIEFNISLSDEEIKNDDSAEDTFELKFDEKEDDINLSFGVNDDDDQTEELKLEDLGVDEEHDEPIEIKFDETESKEEPIDISFDEEPREVNQEIIDLNDNAEDMLNNDEHNDDAEIDFGFDLQEEEEEHIMNQIPDEDDIIDQPAVIQEEPIKPIDARAVGTSEGLEISLDDDMVDEIVNEDIKTGAELKVNFSEEEEIINELTADYDELQNSTSVVKDFIKTNIKLLTKERVCIMLEDKEITLTDYKSFFEGKIEEKRREKIYSRIREIEMQYLFENYIKCFDYEGFTRKKISVDNRMIKNILKLKNEVSVNVFASETSVSKESLPKGEIGFILSSKLELDFDEYLSDIRYNKLNCESVYLVVLTGVVIDEMTFKSAEKYGVKIIRMDVPISIINKTLEDIKRKLK